MRVTSSVTDETARLHRTVYYSYYTILSLNFKWGAGLNKRGRGGGDDDVELSTIKSIYVWSKRNERVNFDSGRGHHF